MASRVHRAPSVGSVKFGTVRVVLVLALIAGSVAYQTLQANPAWASQVSVEPDGAAATCPADSAAYDVVVANQSLDTADTYALTATSASGWRVELRDAAGTVTLAVDETGDGTWETVAPEADSDIDGVADTGELAAEAEAGYQVVVLAPAGSEGDVDTTTFLAVSAADDAHRDAASLVTTVRDCVPPSIAVSESATPGSFYETGGTASFAIEVANTSGEDLTLTALSNSVFGDLLDPGNALVDPGTNTCPVQGTALAAGAVLSCSFDATLADDGSGVHTNTVTATAVDADLNEVTRTDDASVSFSNLLPAVAVSKSASPAALDAPGTVTFTIDVTNASGEDVTLTGLSDSVFGNLLDGANPAIANNTCDDADPAIAAWATVTCSFEAALADGGTGPHVNTVTATVTDDEATTASDADGASVAFDSSSLALDVEKSASPGSLPETGGTVTFNVDITNTAAVSVTLTELSDSVFGNLLDAGNLSVANSSCDDAATPSIDAGATFSCSFEATLADDGSGVHADTVTATVEDAGANSATGSDGASVSFSNLLPSVSVTKTPSAGAVAEPGGTVTFTVEVANSSSEDVTLTGLVDSVFGDLLDVANAVPANNTCATAAPAIAAGATLACSFDGYIVGDYGDAAHLNSVTATVADDESSEASDGAVAEVLFSDVLPSLSVDKTPSLSSVPEPAGDVTFTIEVTNTSPEDVTLTALSDSVFGDLIDEANPEVENNTCATADPVIAAAATLTCSFDGAVEGAAGGDPHTNTVTATVIDDDANTATGSADAAVAFDAVNLAVTKTPSATSVPEPGDDVTFTIEVDNTSGGALTLTALSDSVFGDLLDEANAEVESNTCAIADPAIADGATLVCSFDGYVEGDAGDPDHSNTVTATVEDGAGAESVGTAEATVSFDAVTLVVTKTPSATSVPEPGDDVTFTIEVENAAAGAVTLTALSDSVFGDLLAEANTEVEANTCATAPSRVIAAGATLTCAFDGYVEGDFGDADHSNTVTATVEDGAGAETVGTAEATVSFDAVALAVTKTPSATSVAEPGDDVTFTVQVANTSAGSLTLTVLSDNVFGDLFAEANTKVEANTCATAPSRVIAAGSSFTCTFGGYVEGDFGDADHVNTVTATAKDQADAEVSASGDATIKFADALPTVTVMKTPSATSVAEPGGDVTFTLAVTNTSGESITLTALTDSVFGNLRDGANTLVTSNTCAAAATTIVSGTPLSCSFSGYVEGDFGDASHTNTVTAKVADDEGNTATGQGSATVGFVASIGVVAGHAFVDVDGDGTADASDPPLAGLRVLITDSGGVSAVATSDALGDWELTVPAGATTITVDGTSVPDGYVLTTGNENQTVTVAGNAVKATEPVGYRPPLASVSGSLWLDLDGNTGERAASEPPLVGVTVYLLDVSGTVLRETVTDAAGYYEFTGLAPGEYSIGIESVSVPDGLVVAGDGTRSVQLVDTFTLLPGAALTSQDAVYEGTGIAGDQVWIDANADGTAGTDEEHLAGAEIGLSWGGFDGSLGTADDYQFASVMSDAAGLFRFDRLPPGTYRMTVHLSSVDVALTPTTPVTVEFTLGAGEVWLGGDFGFAAEGFTLPYTGLDTGRLGLTALLLAAVGVAMLRSASVTERRLRAAALWRNRLGGQPRPVREPKTWRDQGGFLD